MIGTKHGVLSAALALLVATSASAQMMETSTAMANSPKTIVDVAVEAGSFKTLVAALKAADLVGTLQGKGPFTVFAPTDEAFAKLPAGTVDALLKDPKKLAAILTYHVVSGEVKAADLIKAGGATPQTLEGQALDIQVRNGKVYVNGAQVTAADVAATNGVIHVIDTVLLPPASK
jgi:uncharacterized surface protein with fasciclin (FAS1) repeats